MISLTVQELSRWQTDKQTGTHTNTTENNTTLAARVLIKRRLNKTIDVLIDGSDSHWYHQATEVEEQEDLA